MNIRRFRSRRTALRSSKALGFRPLVEDFERRQLLAATNFLQGVVTDTGSNPLAGATVTLFTLPGLVQVGSPVVTGADGRYLFSGLNTGSYRIVETPPSGLSNVSTAALTPLYKNNAGMSTSSIDVTISDGVSPALPWLITPTGSNKTGISFVQGPNGHDSAVGQFGINVFQQDVPYAAALPTFCVDLNRDIFPPPFGNDMMLPYDVMPLATGLLTVPGASAANAGEIGYLYNHFGLGTLSQTDSAGLQFAIWQLEYGNIANINVDHPPPNTSDVLASEANFLALGAGHSESAYFLNGLPTMNPSRPTGSQGLIATNGFNFFDSGQPHLGITKSADQTTIVAGSTAGFTVTLTSNGTSPATGIMLSDPLPPGAGNDINWMIDTTTGNPADFQITGAVGSQNLGLSPSFIGGGDSLAPGQSISVHVTGLTHAADANPGGGSGGGGSALAALGPAGAYTVLYEGTGGHNLQITNVKINGNVGVGGTGHAQFNGPGTIGGRIDFSAGNSGQFSNNNGSNVGPTSANFNVAAVTSALSTVNSLNTALGALPGTSIALNGTQTVNESAGTLGMVNGQAYRVFNVTSYNEGNGNLVTINGDGSGDPVVFNFAFNSNVNLGGDVALAGTGLTSDDFVLWNFTTSGKNINLNNNASSFPLPLAFRGILLAPNDGMSVVNSNLDGRVFGGNSSDMQIVSGDTINGPSGGMLVNTATASATNLTAQMATATINVTSAPQLAAGSSSTAGAGLTELLDPAGTLQAGQIPVAVNLPQGPEATAVQAAITSAVAKLNAEVAPLGVSLVRVFGADASGAPVQISFAPTSAIGGVNQGIMGAFTSDGQITVINGWNWYFGSDAKGIARDQYDFQSVLGHELGHVLGLGENSDPSSVMSLYLNPGQVRRDLSATDLGAIQEELQGSAAFVPTSVAVTASGDSAGAAIASPSVVNTAVGSPAAPVPAGLAAADPETSGLASSSIAPALQHTVVPGFGPLGDAEELPAGPAVLLAGPTAMASENAQLAAAAVPTAVMVAASSPAAPVVAGSATGLLQGCSSAVNTIAFAQWPSVLPALETTDIGGMTDRLLDEALTALAGAPPASFAAHDVPIDFGTSVPATATDGSLGDDLGPTSAAAVAAPVMPATLPTWLSADRISDAEWDAGFAVPAADDTAQAGLPAQDEQSETAQTRAAVVGMGLIALTWQWRSHFGRKANDRKRQLVLR
jgi:uncharacterized repeat protein (TIGR01451 family)